MVVRLLRNFDLFTAGGDCATTSRLPHYASGFVRNDRFVGVLICVNRCNLWFQGMGLVCWVSFLFWLYCRYGNGDGDI